MSQHPAVAARVRVSTYRKSLSRIILGDAERGRRCVYCVEDSLEDEGFGGEATILHRLETAVGAGGIERLTFALRTNLLYSVTALLSIVTD